CQGPRQGHARPKEKQPRSSFRSKQMTDEERERIMAETRATLRRMAGFVPHSASEFAPKVQIRSSPDDEWRLPAPEPEPPPQKLHTCTDWSGWEAWWQARFDAAIAGVIEQEREVMAYALSDLLTKLKAANKSNRELLVELKELRIAVEKLRSAKAEQSAEII